MAKKTAKPKQTSSEYAEQKYQERLAKNRGGVSAPVKVFIIVVAAIMVLSTVLGAVASFANSRNNQSVSLSSLEDVDNQFAPQAETLEQQLAKDPDNYELLSRLGSLYLSWGYYSSMFSTVDAETLTANQRLEQAITYIDQALEIEDSASLRVDRAVAKYYEGDSTSAIATLQECVEAYPEYGPAWANLGLFYESRGHTSDALDAYAKAIEVDPDDEQGSKSFAEERIAAINAQGGSATTGTGSGAGDLNDTLSGVSGTGF